MESLEDNLESTVEHNTSEAFTKHVPKIKSEFNIVKPQLPIHENKAHILKLVEENRVVVITGDTGSGKSTQLAQFLLEAGYAKRGTIGITQPRRVGAVSVARRVAEELGVMIGQEVGYTVRFEDCTSRKTKIRFLTDGCLLRECLFHPDLEPYSVLILDEAHERSLQTDILFGIIRQILNRNSAIKFIITSATLDSNRFSEFFFNCPTFHVQGRCFPVTISHAERTEKRYYVEAAVEHAVRIHSQEPLGDILIFLTGEEEIQRACKLMGQKVDQLDEQGVPMPDIVILAAYAALSAQLQQQIFLPAPPNCRKVIFSTNICETSLTVDGVVYVVDCGYVKQKNFNPMTGMESLVIVPISQVQAVQRTGRAGRTQEGKCIRLYSKATFDSEMPLTTEPEIKRTNLANMVLLLKEFGVEDPLSFRFLDAPQPELIIKALQELYWLGALDEEGNLTNVGKQMGQFPLDPALSKMLLLSVQHGCTDDILSITAMMSIENLYERPSDPNEVKNAESKHKMFATEFGDQISMLCIYDSWREAVQESDSAAKNFCQEHYFQVKSLEKAKAVRSELEEILMKFHRSKKSYGTDDDSIKKCRRVIAESYFYHAARKTGDDRRYKPVLNEHMTNSITSSIYIHPTSSLALVEPKWVVYTELMVTSRPFMKNACAIEYGWIEQLIGKLKKTNIFKLIGRSVIPSSLDAIEIDPEEKRKIAEEKIQREKELAAIELGKRKITEENVNAAKLRYLQRKK